MSEVDRAIKTKLSHPKGLSSDDPAFKAMVAITYALDGFERATQLRILAAAAVLIGDYGHARVSRCGRVLGGASGQRGSEAVKVPSPRVRVITWSKQMRLRRRFEVRLIDGGDGENLAMGSSAEGVPLARFARKEQAVIFARAVRAYFRSWASTLAPLPIGTGEP